MVRATKENAGCLISCVTSEVQCDRRLPLCSHLTVSEFLRQPGSSFSLQMFRLLESVDREAGEKGPLIGKR